MLDETVNDPNAEAIDPPGNDGGGGLASQAPEEAGATAIDPPANDGGGGG